MNNNEATTRAITCYDCGEEMEEPFFTDDCGDAYCEECFYNRFTTCDECGAVIDRDDAVYIEDTHEAICEDCTERSGNYFCCSDCGTWYSTAKLALENDDVAICYYCGDDWEECADCGGIFRSYNGAWNERDECWYCDACYNDHSGTIEEYGYTPSLRFLRTAEDDTEARFYGVELEVDGNYACDDEGCAGAIADATDDVYMKHDGSLENGFEIVTHPATLQYHLQRLPWQRITATCRDFAFLSHDTTTCGLHIHIGRAQLPEDTPEKLLIIFEKFWSQLVKFSRRNATALARWAAQPDYGAQPTDDAGTLKEKAEKQRGKGRYQAVNLRNYETIEIRIFRGTLKYTTIFAALQLMDTMLDYCEAHSAAELMQATWEEITRSDFAELRAYLEERGL